MVEITALTSLQVGNKIHAPILNKDYIIFEYSYSTIFKKMIANLAPLDKNDKGFTISLEDMIKLFDCPFFVIIL